MQQKVSMFGFINGYEWEQLLKNIKLQTELGRCIRSSIYGSLQGQFLFRLGMDLQNPTRVKTEVYCRVQRECLGELLNGSV